MLKLLRKTLLWIIFSIVFAFYSIALIGASNAQQRLVPAVVVVCMIFFLAFKFKKYLDKRKNSGSQVEG